MYMVGYSCTRRPWCVGAKREEWQERLARPLLSIFPLRSSTHRVCAFYTTARREGTMKETRVGVGRLRYVPPGVSLSLKFASTR